MSGQPEVGEIFVANTSKASTQAQDPYTSWATEERLFDVKYHFPARSGSTEEENDPYATVLFADVQPFLLDLKSERARNVFRLIWLSFLGLHIPGFAASLSTTPWDNTDDRWSTTTFRSSHYLNYVFPREDSLRLLLPDAQAGVLVGHEQEYSIFASKL